MLAARAMYERYYFADVRVRGHYGSCDDSYRIEYLKSHIEEMKKRYGFIYVDKNVVSNSYRIQWGDCFIRGMIEKPCLSEGGKTRFFLWIIGLQGIGNAGKFLTQFGKNILS